VCADLHAAITGAKELLKNDNTYSESLPKAISTFHRRSSSNASETSELQTANRAMKLLKKLKE